MLRVHRGGAVQERSRPLPALPLHGPLGELQIALDDAFEALPGLRMIWINGERIREVAVGAGGGRSGQAVFPEGLFGGVEQRRQLLCRLCGSRRRWGRCRPSGGRVLRRRRRRQQVATSNAEQPCAGGDANGSGQGAASTPAGQVRQRAAAPGRRVPCLAPGRFQYRNQERWRPFSARLASFRPARAVHMHGFATRMANHHRSATRRPGYLADAAASDRQGHRDEPTRVRWPPSCSSDRKRQATVTV